jgi:hypothetical protein
VLVFNTAYGKVEQLPFDLKMRRTIRYHMPESCPPSRPPACRRRAGGPSPDILGCWHSQTGR